MMKKRVILAVLFSSMVMAPAALGSHAINAHWSLTNQPLVRVIEVQDGIAPRLSGADLSTWRTMRNKLLTAVVGKSEVLAIRLEVVQNVVCEDAVTSPIHPGNNVLQLCMSAHVGAAGDDEQSDTYDWTGDGHIDGSQVGMSRYWITSPGGEAIMCHMIGHGLGLKDRYITGTPYYLVGNSCMYSTAYDQFDAHDYAVLEQIHGHTD